ncbi:MAG: ABC transporter permease [bacterium]
MVKSYKQLKYYELVKRLAATGFKLKYQGSFFGYLWSLMKPLFLFMVLYVVFTVIFKLGKAIPNYPIYLLIGITLWGFFAETTSMCMGSIVASGDLIRKVYFPRIILPIATSLTSFLTFILNLVVIFGFMAYAHIPITIDILWLPLILIEFYVFTLGVSLFLSSLYVRFRDIGPIWEVACQALFYATPIIYAPNLVPIKYLKILMLSPLAQIFQAARASILPSEVITSSTVLGKYWMLPLIIVIITFIVGYITFVKTSAKFAEEV